MKSPKFVLLVSFLISPAAYTMDLDMKDEISTFLNQDLKTPIDRAQALINKSPTLAALVGGVINDLLEKKVNSPSFKVEVYPTMSKNFVVTKTSHYIAGSKHGEMFARIVNEALVLGLVRVGIAEQEKAAVLKVGWGNQFSQLMSHYYLEVKREHPEWNEEQVIETATQLVNDYLEVKKNPIQEKLQQQLEEYVKTDEFKTHVHNRWMYYAKRHLGGVALTQLGSKALKNNNKLSPLLYNETTSTLVAGIRVTALTLPVLTTLSNKLHPNLTIKHPSVSLEGLSKKESESTTTDISLGGQVTIFDSELLKIKLKGSTTFSGSHSFGICLQAGM